jgi:hypothetical protein
MKKYFNYFKTICIHKWYVFVECCKLGIFWQGIIHDLSKFSLYEFILSAQYYHDGKNDTAYQEAWLHHKGHNKHHWEYWVDWDSFTGDYILIHIPSKYLKEICADMIGASKAYNKGKYNKKEPLIYFKNNCQGWKIKTEDREFIANMLKEIELNN